MMPPQVLADGAVDQHRPEALPAHLERGGAAA